VYHVQLEISALANELLHNALKVSSTTVTAMKAYANPVERSVSSCVLC